MPLIRYECTCQKVKVKMYKRREDAPAAFTCKCGDTMIRKLSGPSLASVVTVDNGVQAKAVDVNLEVVESNIENAKKDFREK